MYPDPTSPSSERERARLESLARYAVMDTPPDATLDEIVDLACDLTGAPICLVSLLDADRQWFKARRGIAVSETARDVAFCDTVVRTSEPLVVEDALEDERFAKNPLVVGDPCVRFYAGFPLANGDGHVLGTLCILDRVPRQLSGLQRTQLISLAHLVMAELELLRRNRELERCSQELADHERFFETSLDLHCVATTDGFLVRLNHQWTTTLGFSEDELRAVPFVSFVHPDDAVPTLRALRGLAEGRDVVRFRNRYRTRNGGYRWFEWSALPSLDGLHVYATARDVTELVGAETELREKNEVLSLISRLQTGFLAFGDHPSWWRAALDAMLDVTASKVGILGRTGADHAGPFMRIAAATSGATTTELPGGVVVWDAHSPLGSAFATGKPSFANTLDREVELPGFGPIFRWLALPIRHGSEVVAMLGLANSDEEYTAELVSVLEPILSHLGAVVSNMALAQQRAQFVEEIAASKELQASVLESSDVGYVALGCDGTVAFANRVARGWFQGLNAAALPRIENLFVLDTDRQWCGRLIASPAVDGPAVRLITIQGGLGESLSIEAKATPLHGDDPERRGLLLTLTDVRARQALAATVGANAILEARLEELRQQQRDNGLISECVEYLQSSASVDEGLELISRSLRRLFPGARIDVYASAAEEGVLSLHWSTVEPVLADDLSAAECWALRARRAHGSWPGVHHLACRHRKGVGAAAHFCVPLIALDRIVALISMEFHGETEAVNAARHAVQLSQFVAMAQSFSGALSGVALRSRLEKAALSDPLTELANRRSLRLEVGRALSRARRSGQPFAFGVIDIDHFKRVNDVLGHDGGDGVLRLVAQCLRHSVRDGDLVGRLGGEEFGVFLFDILRDEADRRFEAIREAVRSRVSTPAGIVTVSIGSVQSNDVDPLYDFDDVFRRADAALFRAKDLGRDRVVPFRGMVDGEGRGVGLDASAREPMRALGSGGRSEPPPARLLPP